MSQKISTSGRFFLTVLVVGFVVLVCVSIWYFSPMEATKKNTLTSRSLVIRTNHGTYTIYRREFVRVRNAPGVESRIPDGMYKLDLVKGWDGSPMAFFSIAPRDVPARSPLCLVKAEVEQLSRELTISVIRIGEVDYRYCQIEFEDRGPERLEWLRSKFAWLDKGN